MIPIVYDKNDTQRTTNGLGRLVDCIECTVENNAEDYSCELHIVYPYDGFHAELLDYANVIGVQVEPHGNIQLFDVYKIEQDESGNKVADAHHVRHRLKYLPTTWVYGENIATIIRSLNMVHVGAKIGSFGSLATEAGTKNFGYHNPFVFWTNITRDSLFYQITYFNETAYGNVRFSARGYKYAMTTSKQISQTFWEILFGNNGLVKIFGLAVRFDNFNVYISEPNSLSADKTKDVVLRYGKDMKAFSMELDSSDYELYTHVIPYRTVHRTSGESTVDIMQFFMTSPSENNSFPVVYEIPDLPFEVSSNRYLSVDVQSITRFPSQSQYYVIGDETSRTNYTISNEELEALSIAKAKEINADKVSPSFSVDMVSLREHSLYTEYKNLETVSLGDVVSVALEPMNVVVEEQILTTEYNVLSELFNTVAIGSVINRVSDILFELSKRDEDSGSSSGDVYLEYSDDLTMYTQDQTPAVYNDGEIRWALNFDYYDDNDNQIHIVSEPIRSVGNMVTGNIMLRPEIIDGSYNPSTGQYTTITLPAGTPRKVLENLPIPMMGEVQFTFPYMDYQAQKPTGGYGVEKYMDYKIDSNGDLYIVPQEDTDIVYVYNRASHTYKHFPLNFQYISAQGIYDKSWKNYITTTDANWKERDAV